MKACLSLISACLCAICVMQKHGFGDAEVSHRALFEEYLSSHVTVCPEPGPCRDENLLNRAAQKLLLQPLLAPNDSATLTRLYPLVIEKILTTSLTQLSDLVRATELLETLCLNLYLQPWRREIRSLKTFTGAFVYFLVPALSTKTLQYILATIGYLPHKSGPSPSEYRLCEEASPEQALQVAFELLLTRALCLHLPQQDQPTVQEWVETIKQKLLPGELSLLSENIGDDATEGEGHKTEEEELDPEASQEEPGLPEDQSIFPLHVTYPDLVFRGRPLLQDHDSTPLQHTVLPPHRRHAQRVRVPPTSRPTNKDNTGDEGLSGPVGLSLHITLRPQISGFPTRAEHHHTADLDGHCEDNSSVRSEAEEEATQLSNKPVEPLITGDTDGFTQDGPTSTGSDSEDDSL